MFPASARLSGSIQGRKALGPWRCIRFSTDSKKESGSKKIRLALITGDTVLFPGRPTELKITQPAFVVLLTELRKKKQNSFGFVALKDFTNQPPPLQTDWHGEDVGTVTLIKSKKSLKDGSILLNILGTERFAINHRVRSLYGYWEGNLEILEDAVADTVRAQNLAAEAKQVILSRAGQLYQPEEMPQDVKQVIDHLQHAAALNDGMSTFSFYVAHSLDIDQLTRMKLLSTKCTIERLELELQLLKDNLKLEVSQPISKDKIMNITFVQ